MEKGLRTQVRNESQDKTAHDSSRGARVDVFSFSSHIAFIKAFLDAKQNSKTDMRSKSSWSLGSWSRRLELQTSTTLTNILKGRKLPSIDLTQRMAITMDLKPLEMEYFQTLVEIERQKGSPELVHIGLRRKLRALENLAKSEPASERQFQFVCLPHHYVLRTLVTLKTFKEDPEWIQKQLHFPITSDEIRHALQDLLHAGLLTRNRDGKLIPTAPFHDTRKTTPSDGMNKYLQATLDHAKRSVTETPISERTIANNVFSVRADRIDEMKAFIHEFRNEFMGAFDTEDGSGDRVYQLNLQLFPSAALKEETSNE